jgi:hypothetical protein
VAACSADIPALSSSVGSWLRSWQQSRTRGAHVGLLCRALVQAVTFGEVPGRHLPEVRRYEGAGLEQPVLLTRSGPHALRSYPSGTRCCHAGQYMAFDHATYPPASTTMEPSGRRR